LIFPKKINYSVKDDDIPKKVNQKQLIQALMQNLRSIKALVSKL